ncbi:hypothetical protein BASA81_004755 [Batrachochytrium salamandrivorans]|nr:hypothetical protein BASA81_004755 [Batrachochytrium salamandrivorans]
MQDKEEEIKEFERQYINPKRRSQVRNGSFSAVMALEKQAELEAEYLKLHDMFPEENTVVEETFFEQEFAGSEEEEEGGGEEKTMAPPKRRGTITRLMGLAKPPSASSSTSSPKPSSKPAPTGELPPLSAKKRSGSLFARLAGSNGT